MSQLPFMQQLEAHGNELEVRERLAKGQYHGEHLGLATEWLRRKDEARALEASTKRDTREERTLRLASRANIIALIAIAIAAMSSAKEIKWLVTSVISWLP